MSSEWFLCTHIYDEGVMVSSNRDPTESINIILFDKPSSRPVSKVKEYIFPPAAQSTQHDGENFSDRRAADPIGQSYFMLTVTHSHRIKSPKFWCPDKPHVYTLVVVLRSCADGGVIQAESCRVAFRVVDVKDGLLRVNTKPVMIRGTNCSRGFFGLEMSEIDVQLMKRNNINALRIPSRFHFSWIYELCTLYGVYVVDEVYLRCSGISQLDPKKEAEMENVCLRNLCRMFEAGKNHPCIIIWSLGNDSSYDRIHDKMAQWVRKRFELYDITALETNCVMIRDPTRLVFFERASYGPRPGTAATGSTHNAPRIMATDILGPMHADIGDCIVLANRYPDLPLILSDYSITTANSGGNVSVYWKAFNRYPRLQGGFVHSWHDQLLLLRNDSSKSLDIVGNNIVYGVVPLHSSSCNPSMSTMATYQKCTVVVKPQLLELKQCMKQFECIATDVMFTTEVLDHKSHTTADFTVDLSVQIGLSISNLMDHSDIEKVMNFEVVLLINGVAVQASQFIQQDSAVVHCNRGWEDAGGRIHFQEIKGFSMFTLPLLVNRKEPRYFRANGITWPEDYLLMCYNADWLNDRIINSHYFTVELSAITSWDIVVIGRSISKTSWCDDGFPLGFVQLRIPSESISPWKEAAGRALARYDNEICEVAGESSPPIMPNYSVSVDWNIDRNRTHIPNVVVRAGLFLS
jgi:hypothetical protein